MFQSKGLKRNLIDKYYTKENIVNDCISIIKTKIEINKDDLIIEPSCGNGAFISGIKLLTDNYKFYDLEPENEEIEKQDYLALQNPSCNKKIHIIGNPPFGRQSSLAVKFMKKSCEYCDSISFILPKSFKKDSIKNKIPLNFSCIFEYDLPDNSFVVNKKEYDVPCVLQIWKKTEILRPVIEKVLPVNFIFVKKENEPHISVRRVGYYSGKIDKNIIDKNIETHYFIKFTNDLSIDKNIELLKNISFSHNNTAGPKSISKPELINKYNLVLTA